MYRFIWLIPLLPLVGAAINGLLGRNLRFSERVIGSIAVGSVALAFVLSVGAVFSYGFESSARWPAAYITSQDGGFRYTWFSGGAVRITQGTGTKYETRESVAHLTTSPNSGEVAAALDAAPDSESALLDVEWSYQLDPLSALFILIVTGVGLCIFVFAIGYMHGDPGMYRFFAFMGLFMFSMLILVMGSNFLMMFVGWEGVGLCSYLLIGYYLDRREAAEASKKAFIVNRIGDFGFILALFGIIATFGSVQFTEVNRLAAGFPLEALGTWGLMSWLALGLFVGACGKSAQIPLFVWLPDAMAGPTPVSALIHAATMVTAGLYMVVRTNVIFQHSQTMMAVVAVVGAVTALFAATIGITQNDIKRVLAYSTVSQLGLMFLACGVGSFAIGIFHVMTHAFFKGLMFLGAGSVIHGMHHEQDMRRMGGLSRYMPYTYWTFLAGWLAICGIIPFSGFWSKDEILWSTAATSYIPGGWILWLVATIASACTAFYMTRMVALTFWGEPRFFKVSAGSEGDEAHAQAYAKGITSHDASVISTGDRPHHEPGEHVGLAHEIHAGHRGRHIHDEHEHGELLPRESPPVMWIPLVVLAILATVGGFVGVGPAFKFITGSDHPGGRANIVNWLEPVIWNPSTGSFGGEHTTGAGSPAIVEGGGARVGGPYGNVAHTAAETVENQFGSHTAAEWFFIAVSLAVAGLGIFLGWLFYARDPRLPDIWARRLGPLYWASYYKYRVDELYDLLFVRRTIAASGLVYTFDSRVLDGAVNGIAWLTRTASRITGAIDQYVVDGVVNFISEFVAGLMSRVLRAAQTGFAPNYALVMVLGLVIAMFIFFGGDILSAFRSAFAFNF